MVVFIVLRHSSRGPMRAVKVRTTILDVQFGVHLAPRLEMMRLVRLLWVSQTWFRGAYTEVIPLPVRIDLAVRTKRLPLQCAS
jgi:hypothetical protein